MSDPLLIALVQHTLVNCPTCHGTGEVVVDVSLSFGRPIKWETCHRCRPLREALQVARDPA